MKASPYIYVFLVMSVLSSCYSFKGISIPPEADTFYVKDFTLRTNNAPADIDQKFAEALRSKIRTESRLKYDTNNPDIDFEGSISSYKVVGTAPQEGNTVALNKLTIIVSISYANHTKDDDEWTESFSYFKDFDATLDFNSVENGFIDEIFTQLTEDIFNKAFTNW